MEERFAIYPSLREKNILVTGGASGIGKEIVKAFANQKAKVAFLDLDAAKGQKLSSKLGDNVFFEECDLKNIKSLKETIHKFRSEIGPFDILVNNAAHDDRHDWTDITEEYWDERFATNLRHHFFTIQSVAKDMIQKGGGSIINIGSNSWWEAVGNFPAYATAKSAVHGLTRTLARDLGKHRIRVNTVVPGWIMTERQVDMWLTPESEKELMDRQCIKRKLFPKDIARFVLFMASDEASACSNQSFVVDGGWL